MGGWVETVSEKVMTVMIRVVSIPLKAFSFLLIFPLLLIFISFPLEPPSGRDCASLTLVS